MGSLQERCTSRGVRNTKARRPRWAHRSGVGIVARREIPSEAMELEAGGQPLPAEARARRREELAGDVWEYEHDTDETRSAAGLAARVVLGVPADLLWRAREHRPVRRLTMPTFAVDRASDRRMRWIGRSIVLGVVALLAPIALGLPILLVFTLPAAAVAARPRDRRQKKGTVMPDATKNRSRRIRFIVVATSAVVFALGLLIDSLPSDETHDRYWLLFVAPMMIACTVGVVALPMLVWSLLPRRDDRPVDA